VHGSIPATDRAAAGLARINDGLDAESEAESLGRGAFFRRSPENDGAISSFTSNTFEGLYAAGDAKDARHDQDAEGAV
jgi:hypothetical protein